ncbi:MAG: SDR family oxidoreductase [Myxococcaceae bacterium]
MLKPKGPSGFGYGSTAEEVTQGLSLSGKTILLTGCNSGLGFETLRVLTARGARVLATARTVEKAKAAGASVGGSTLPLACELSDPASVASCVSQIKQDGAHLNAIICNAGIMAMPKLEKAFGYELQFFTNHIGHFALVTGLLQQLADAARVIVLSSGAHAMAPKEGIEFDNLSGDRGYTAWRAYGQSKMANLLFAKELSRRFAGTQKVANAVHPGVIRTNLGRHMNPVMNAVFGLMGPLTLKSVAEGAATECWAAVHPAAATLNGAYVADCNVAKSRPDADDPALAKRLWTVSEEIVARVQAA